MRHGDVTRRTGSQHIDVTKDYSQASYMARFVFNQDQTYLIEVGEEYFRFYRGTSQIVVSGVDAWSAITAYEVGDLASLAGVNYYCILAHTNQTPPNATYWYPLTDDIYEIPTPYALADLDRLRFTQSADVITITHSGYDTMELRRTGHTAWTLVAKNYGDLLHGDGGRPGLVRRVGGGHAGGCNGRGHRGGAEHDHVVRGYRRPLLQRVQNIQRGVLVHWYRRKQPVVLR